MAKSYYLDNAFLSAVLNGVAYTSPTQILVALYTSSPGPGGGGVEVSNGSSGYARTAGTFSLASQRDDQQQRLRDIPAGCRALGHHRGVRAVRPARQHAVVRQSHGIKDHQYR
jgi:hypothetical protein